MENPAEWGQAEKVIDEVLREFDQFAIGSSLALQIADALRAAHLLVVERRRCDPEKGVHVMPHVGVHSPMTDAYNKKTARIKKSRIGYRIEYSIDGTQDDKPVIALSEGGGPRRALTFNGACRKARRGIGRRIDRETRRDETVTSFSVEKRAGRWRWVN